MSEQAFFDAAIVFWFALAFVTFPVLLYIPAPYGRHMWKRGISLSTAWGWVAMESPAVLVFGAMFLVGAHRFALTELVFLFMWMAHYLQRAFVYPFLQRGSGKRISLLVVVLGCLFNIVNGYLNGRCLFEFSGGYPVEWMKRWCFLLGGGLFVLGYIVNRRADKILRGLRAPGESGYQIPRGGLFRWVSCPNYLGEIVIWLGWAIATRSLPGLAFAVWTIANLAPRARSHHRWYQARFPDYPAQRKALLPGVW